MNDHQFDRISRLLSSPGSRRQALAAFGALALARAVPASAATQIETAACGEAGAVCTQLIGCCSGLVCATSYTNPAYGVCVTGEGDMLAVSDDIVVPGAEGVEAELAQLVTGAAGSGTGAESILAAQEAEIQSRKDAKRSRNATQQSERRSTTTTQQTRRATNHSTQQSRRATNRSERLANREAKRLARELNKTPRIDVTWFNTAGPGKETLRVDNRDDFSVVISRVEAIKGVDAVFTGSVTILPDGTYRFVSDPTAKDTTGVSAWTPEDICPPAEDDNGEGVRLTVKRLGATQTHRFIARCHEPSGAESTGATNRQSEKSTAKKRRGQEQSKRGKGQ